MQNSHKNLSQSEVFVPALHVSQGEWNLFCCMVEVQKLACAVCVVVMQSKSTKGGISEMAGR